jgi:hypothetical protein
MTIEFDSDELRELVKDSYELMMSIPAPRSPKYEIGSRSKLKNLPEALHEFEDAHSSVTHFIKSAAYFLPRSDNELSDFLDVLLDKVKKIQASENDPEKIREKIRYLIGYSNWSMDAVCNIFKISNNDDVKTKNRLKTMISTEFKILGAEDDVDYLVTKIMQWKASGQRGR